MSKRPTDPESAQQPPKKSKTSSVFHTAVPRLRPTPTVNEPPSSGSTSRSTVVTLSKSEDGQRRVNGKYRNRQERGSTQPKEQFPDTCIVEEPAGIPNSEEQSATVTPERSTTQPSKPKRQRNNNTSVSHYGFFKCLVNIIYIAH